MSTRAAQFEILAAGVMYGGELIIDPYVKFFGAGTNTPKNAWADIDKSTPFTKLALDTNGRGTAYGDGWYKLTFYSGDPDADPPDTGVALFTIDYYRCQANSTNTRNVISNTTVTPDDDLVIANGEITITLSPVNSFEHPVTIKNGSTNQVTIVASTGDTIDGETSTTIPSQYDALTFYPDALANTWRVTGKLSTDLGGGTLILDPGGASSISAPTDNNINITTDNTTKISISGTIVDYYVPINMNGNAINLDDDDNSSISAATNDEIVIKTNNTSRVKVTNSGVEFDTTAKLKGNALALDSDGNSTISASSNDIIEIKTGGTKRVDISTSEQNMYLPLNMLGQAISLDSDKNTTINSPSDNTIRVVTNGTTMFDIIPGEIRPIYSSLNLGSSGYRFNSAYIGSGGLSSTGSVSGGSFSTSGNASVGGYVVNNGVYKKCSYSYLSGATHHSFTIDATRVYRVQLFVPSGSGYMSLRFNNVSTGALYRYTYVEHGISGTGAEGPPTHVFSANANQIYMGTGGDQGFFDLTIGNYWSGSSALVFVAFSTQMRTSSASASAYHSRGGGHFTYSSQVTSFQIGNFSANFTGYIYIEEIYG